jgi:hypothetical protein
MVRTVQALAILGAMMMSLSACGGSSTSPSGGIGSSGSNTGIGGSGGTTVNTLTASIDGTPFTATTIAALVRNNILSVAGTAVSGSTTTTLSIATTARVGTQVVAPGTGVNSNYQVVSGTNTAGWLASDNFGSGTVTVTTLTTTRAAGSFSFILSNASGTALGPKNVTVGVFDVTISQ